MQVNFKKQSTKIGTKVPEWAHLMLDKVCPDQFIAAELGVIEYEESKGAYMPPHIDDAWLWGER